MVNRLTHDELSELTDREPYEQSYSSEDESENDSDHGTRSPRTPLIPRLELPPSVVTPGYSPRSSALLSPHSRQMLLNMLHRNRDHRDGEGDSSRTDDSGSITARSVGPLQRQYLIKSENDRLKQELRLMFLRNLELEKQLKEMGERNMNQQKKIISLQKSLDKAKEEMASHTSKSKSLMVHSALKADNEREPLLRQQQQQQQQEQPQTKDQRSLLRRILCYFFCCCACCHQD